MFHPHIPEPVKRRWLAKAARTLAAVTLVCATLAGTAQSAAADELIYDSYSVPYRSRVNIRYFDSAGAMTLNINAGAGQILARPVSLPPSDGPPLNVPEPTSVVLISVALLGLAAMRRPRRRR